METTSVQLVNSSQPFFRITCRGFKRQITDFCSDDARSLQKRVFKRYISPKNVNNRIECIDEATKNSIESKLASPDVNIFDGAVNLVEHHLATKFYPNFLTSDLFVDHIRVSFLNIKKSFMDSFMDNGVRVAEFPYNPHTVDSQSKYTIGVIL